MKLNLDLELGVAFRQRLHHRVSQEIPGRDALVDKGLGGLRLHPASRLPNHDPDVGGGGLQPEPEIRTNRSPEVGRQPRPGAKLDDGAAVTEPVRRLAEIGDGERMAREDKGASQRRVPSADEAVSQEELHDRQLAARGGLGKRAIVHRHVGQEERRVRGE